MRRVWIESKKILEIKHAMIVQPKDIKITENSYKIENLLENSKSFQDNLNVIFIEKADENILVINWYDNLLKIILGLVLIGIALLLVFFLIAYIILMLWTLMQNIINYVRRGKKKKDF